MTNTGTTAPCALCAKPVARYTGKTIYDHTVCKSCGNSFGMRRRFAFLIDRILWGILYSGFFFLLGIVLASGGVRITDEVAIGLSIFGWLTYLIFCCKDGFAGYSLGKYLLGMQVVDIRTGQPAGFVASLKRNLPLLVPLVPLAIAFQVGGGPRLGDTWAHTRVIWKKYARSPVFGGTGCCEQCGYDLYANTSGICPECGLPVSAVNQKALTERPAPPPTQPV